MASLELKIEVRLHPLVQRTWDMLPELLAEHCDDVDMDSLTKNAARFMQVRTSKGEWVSFEQWPKGFKGNTKHSTAPIGKAPAANQIETPNESTNHHG